jgi:hypothetical protein
VFGNIRMLGREPLDMQFVDDRPVPGRQQSFLPTSSEYRFSDHGPRHEASAVVNVRPPFVVAAATVAEYLSGPGELAPDRASIRVQKQLVLVESMPLPWRIFAVDPVAVKLPGRQTLDVSVPYVAGTPRQSQAPGLFLARWVKQAEIDRVRVTREQGEIDTVPGPVRAER